MATDTAPVNGLYGTNSYNAPAELAASTPSAPTHALSASQSTTASATTQQQKADVQDSDKQGASIVEVSWYFVVRRRRSMIVSGIVTVNTGAILYHFVQDPRKDPSVLLQEIAASLWHRS